MMKRRKTGEQQQSQENGNVVDKVLEMLDQLTLAERSDVNWFDSNDDVYCKSQMIQAPENVVVTCIQFAGYCNEYIVTGSEMPPIVVYAVDPQTQEWRVSNSLIGHEGGVWAMEVASNPNADTAVLSPHFKDKNTLVSGSTDKTVRVWDIQRAQCLYVLQAHSSTVRCLSVCTVDNQLMILSGSRDKSVRAWKVDFAPPSHHHHHHHGDSNFKLQSQSPTQSLQQSQELQVSDVQMDMSQGVKKPAVIQESHHKLDGHTDSVRAIACKYPYSATGSYDATVRLWDLNDGRCIHVLTGHTNKVYSVVIHLHISSSAIQSFNRSGVVISGSLDCTMRVWDIMSGCCVRVIADHASLVGLLQLEELTYIPASFRSPLQRRHQPATSQHPFSRPLNAPRSLLNQSSQLVTPVEKNVQPESLAGVQKILTSSQSITMKSTYPILISAAADSTMKIWHPSCILDYEVDKLHYDRPCISTLSGHPTAITCFQFDSDKIVSGSEGRISVYDTRNAMFVRDLSIGVANSWRVCIDWNKAVCAVDRDETTWIEIYDFCSTGVDTE
ncbi:hypothetical protein MIR68_006912 [Amoeboaphelidium protococcarum]|nr:hypothetical protein MIR68_006912 [Amoeboaphelidium protococcarum]